MLGKHMPHISNIEMWIFPHRALLTLIVSGRQESSKTDVCKIQCKSLPDRILLSIWRATESFQTWLTSLQIDKKFSFLLHPVWDRGNFCGHSCHCCRGMKPNPNPTWGVYKSDINAVFLHIMKCMMSNKWNTNFIALDQVHCHRLRTGNLFWRMILSCRIHSFLSFLFQDKLKQGTSWAESSIVCFYPLICLLVPCSRHPHEICRGW